MFGINHIHASLSHGYVRASAFYVIDGVPVDNGSVTPGPGLPAPPAPMLASFDWFMPDRNV